jgi:hypothetical protein
MSPDDHIDAGSDAMRDHHRGAAACRPTVDAFPDRDVETTAALIAADMVSRDGRRAERCSRPDDAAASRGPLGA